MQVTETVSDGLKREFQVTVPASDLEARVSERLGDLKDQVRINGFRPGKVPVTHLKKVYGRAVMAETIEAIIREMNAKIVSDHGLKLAMEPKVTIPNEETEVEKVIGGQVRPRLYAGARGFAEDRARRLQGHQARASGRRGDRGRGRRGARQDRRAEPAVRGQGRGREGRERRSGGHRLRRQARRPAVRGRLRRRCRRQCRVGHLHPGLRGTAHRHVGRGNAAGEGDLPGRLSASPARRQGSRVRGDGEVDRGAHQRDGRRRICEIARPRVARQAQGGGQGAARSKTTPSRAGKRSSAGCSTRSTRCISSRLPPTLAEQEFGNVWSAVENDLKAQGRTFEDEGTTEEKARAEYRAIAERRVRLGLVLAEIGDKNKISVTEEEISRAIVERARQFPGREQEIWDHYRKNPHRGGGRARAHLRREGGRFSDRAGDGERQAGVPRRTLQGRRRDHRRRLSLAESAAACARADQRAHLPGIRPAS